MDGDGDLDRMVGNLSEPRQLYLNSGNGTFASSITRRLPLGGSPTFALALDDMDRDGDLDVAIG